MLFNSVDFAIFLPIVFLLYWFLKPNVLKIQNLVLLIASYSFYASWDVIFLFLLVFSTLLDYFTGLLMFQSKTLKEKKVYFWLSICINVGFLAVFKYYDFFVTSFVDAMSLLSINANATTLKLILPVGISFYTFHGLSYVIDIYNNKIEPEKDFVNYSLFVSFFPLLVAGPIERATHLLPQITSNRKFEYHKAVDGLRQILWGLFKKIVIADNCANFSNQIFDTFHLQSGSTLVLGAIFFSFQIYADFSGYSDIALGTARLFGIELLRNFSFPYFSRDIGEFWRRWHISLTTWFRDYLYIPLGGSRGSKLLVIRNTLIIFLVSGFWHGANWTFLAWGFYHALLFLPLIVLKNNRKFTDNIVGIFPNLKQLFQIIKTFTLVAIGWVFFRSQTIHEAIDYLKRIFDKSLFTIPKYYTNEAITFFCIFVLLIVEWLQKNQKHGLVLDRVKSPITRWIIYYLIIIIICQFGAKGQTFIYFQF